MEVGHEAHPWLNSHSHPRRRGSLDRDRPFPDRATLLADRLEAETDLTVHRPEAGMFALINVSATGLDGEAYAWDLLQAGVAVMPGSAFGDSLKDWVRVALTISDTDFGTAVSRIIDHANSKSREVA